MQQHEFMKREKMKAPPSKQEKNLMEQQYQQLTADILTEWRESLIQKDIWQTIHSSMDQVHKELQREDKIEQVSHDEYSSLVHQIIKSRSQSLEQKQIRRTIDESLSKQTKEKNESEMEFFDYLM